MGWGALGCVLGERDGVGARGPQRGNMMYEISKSQEISQDFKDFTKISKISK